MKSVQPFRFQPRFRYLNISFARASITGKKFAKVFDAETYYNLTRHGSNLTSYTRMVALQSTSTSAKDVRKESSVARIVGSGSAGILELMLFHPVSLS